MDRLLTEPLLLIGILLGLKLDDDTLYIVYGLFVVLTEATNNEDDPEIKSKIQLVQTVISWYTYSAIYVVPMVPRLPKPWRGLK